MTLSPWQGCYCGYRFELAEPGESDYVASSTEKDIARFASFVLAHIPQGLVVNTLPRLLRERALEMGFRRGKEQVDRRSLQTAMESHYTPTLLAQLDRAYANGKTKRLLSFLGVTGVAIEIPLSRLLLLSNYLFQDAETFLAKLTSIQPQVAGTTFIQPPSTGLHSAIPVNRNTDGLNTLVERLAMTAIAEDLSIKDLWRQHYGAMKRITVAGSKNGIEILKKAIDRHSSKSAQKRGRSSAKVHSRDADWAEEIKKTATRLFNEAGRPTRVSFASLVKNTEMRPVTWPDAISFPQTRAACKTLQESQWHFYARRVMWAMARHHGEAVARTVITEATGLEHHRVTDVYNYLIASAIVPIAPFTTQLAANGITRDWLGPCPGKTYQKVGRGYQKTGVRISYTSPVFAGMA
ncbi:hypothetical protein [Oryzomicrobium sp.]|uniref:hypothetical protein n=1 Tax=Oryzomicrobium sp. TaxID=1911578 RepID=UPI0025F0F8DE|nr:hypothetical protein [Oryzomicrobium sp.]MCE1243671.1 hypothetical protein [Oryzomicrobium sp.]